MPNESINFEDCFEKLTGNKPLSWQRRLYNQWIEDDVKPIIDLPTGLGKTMVIPIWLIAQATNRKLGRRLIYVVDRRTVVDQATQLAEQLAMRPCIRFIHDSLGKPPAISTLRGQFADNREWTRDPSHPAIIIGTVDMIGSRLLFSGYRSSYKQRPLDAGLLGQDSLLVLDEAHLSKPFEKLICGICDKGRFQAGQGSPMRVIRMSATTSAKDENPFKLIDSDLAGNRESNLIVRRFAAEKHLTITPDIEKSKLNDVLCEAAVALAKDNARVVLFVRSPDDATKIAGKIRDHKKAKNQPGPFANAVEVLTGTMRGLERDELLEKPILKRFLDGKETINTRPAMRAILVSTSAGEVGFDLNADHMICDAAPLDSMIQRLGRVNRRGDGIGEMAAQVRVFVAKPDEKKSKKAAGKDEKQNGHTIESASVAAIEVLGKLPKHSDGAYDASPRAFRNLNKPAEALSPDPTMVELTDILLDAWSMTSITEPMPGRPEVAPWLRGIADDSPQTTIAWRAELDIEGFDQLDLEDIEEWFDIHRILAHETLSVPTSAAKDWFLRRWDELDEATRQRISEQSIVIDRAGLRLGKIKDVIAELNRKNTGSIRNAELILPATFGGIDRHKGLLDESAPEVPKDEDKKPQDEQHKASVARGIAPDVADERGRYRELVIKTEGDKPDNRPVASGTKPDNLASVASFAVEIKSDDEKHVQLVSYVPKREKYESGSEPQPLENHVNRVRMRLDEILDRLDLPEVIKRAAQLAANWHDHGKNREFFQRTVGGTATTSGRPWPDQTLGKSGGKDFGKAPRGYRHEFGSLREFLDGQQGNDITHDVVDLAAHLIATHHGRGRPHFPKGGFDPEAESRSPEIHADSIRRFARLQRKYGHWRLTWLENLLRCADAMASAENDVESDGGVP